MGSLAGPFVSRPILLSSNDAGDLIHRPHRLSIRSRTINSQVCWKRQKICKTVIYYLPRPIWSPACNSARASKIFKDVEGALACSFLFHPLSAFHRISEYFSLIVKCTRKLSCYPITIWNFMSWRWKFKHNLSPSFTRLLIAIMLIASFSAAVNKPPSWALSEENLLFLEAWRAVDRAYYDKTFNGQSWFRYRENALRNEPMNSREETYTAIKKMLNTLDDPFTRFLEPEKFKSLRSGTQGALTGVGLSIGYPTALNGSAGLVVMSSSPGGPADKAGVIPGDIILAIDDTGTEDMDIYEAAERLQGAKGSSVKLAIRSGPDIRNIILRREKVTLNPVKSRLCEISRSENDSYRIGYIKLTSFNQNASGAIKDAIQTLRNDDVKAFVLDLRNNSGGLFPEGIEIAKIWMDKGVIVYICDSRGVRDIYETDGTDAIAPSEPLAILVNRGTASASEVLAGALKDNKRAVLYGEPTFGKGKIQSVFELSDGSGLAVTVARYETPAHTDINKVGITPDHPLPSSFPLDEDGFCGCLQDASAPCSLNSAKLFSR